MSKNIKSAVVDSRFKSLKIFSVTSCIIIIIFAILFNVLFDQILGKTLTFDMSATKQNTVCSEFQQLIDTLPNDTRVRIVGLFKKPTNISNSPMQYIVPMLDNLAAKSDGKVSIEYKDLETNPTIIAELDPQNLSGLTENKYVINCNGKNIVIDPAYCFTYDDYTQSVLENNSQSNFANAIYNLTSQNHKNAYFLTGLNEDTHENIKVVMNSLSIDSHDLPVSENFVMPNDCDLLFIYSINSDIPENVAVALKDYIQHGGKMIVAINYNALNSTNEFKNLNDVLHEVNLHIDNFMTVETDADYMMDIYGYNNYIDIAADYQAQFGTTKLCGSFMRPVRKYDNPYSYINVFPLLTTSDAAYCSTISIDGTETKLTPEGAKYNIGMYSTFSGMEVPPEVFVFGTTDLMSDYRIVNFGYGDSNIKFIKKVIQDIVDVEDGIDIPSLPVANYSFDTSKITTKTTGIMTFLFIVIIPLSFVILAVITFNKRKNL